MTAPIAPKRTRSLERAQFLADVLVTAVEHQGYGFIEIVDYEPDPADTAFAVIRDRYEQDNEQDPDAYLASERRIDIDAIAHGIGIITRAVPMDVPSHDRPVSLVRGQTWVPPVMERVLCNPTTGTRIGVSEYNRKRILEASREDDAGELDVVDALAIVECAVFGQVVYG